MDGQEVLCKVKRAVSLRATLMTDISDCHDVTGLSGPADSNLELVRTVVSDGPPSVLAGWLTMI